jgi:hypothetical protein
VTDKLAVVHVDPLDLSFEHDLFRKPDSTFRDHAQGIFRQRISIKISKIDLDNPLKLSRWIGAPRRDGLKKKLRDVAVGRCPR